MTFPCGGGVVSGNSDPVVTLVGSGLAPLVDAIPRIEELTGERPIIIGGLAVMCRLTSAHRATTDIDTVQRQAQGDMSHLEVLLQSPNAKRADPLGVRIPTASGEAKVDVVVVTEADVTEPDDYPPGRLHALSHAWAQETATTLVIGIGPGADIRQAARVAQPGPLVAMKLQAIESRREEKKATDLVDVVRLLLDSSTREVALEQLRSCDPRIAGDVAWHAHKYFTVETTRSLRSVRSVSSDIDSDTLRLVGDLVVGAAIGRVVEFFRGRQNAQESSFVQSLSDALWANPSIATNVRLLQLCRASFSESAETHELLFDALSELPDLVEAHPAPNRVSELIDAIESQLAELRLKTRESRATTWQARSSPMRVGLVGYFGFGNYGDELYRRVHEETFNGHQVSVLRGCDGVTPHDALEIDRQDVIVVGGGDLVDPSQHLARYWDPILLRRPVLIAGVGVNMARTPTLEGITSLSRFFGHPNVQWISTRDEPSRQWIIENLSPAVEVRVHADLVASLPFPRRQQSDTPTLGLVLRGGHSQDRSHVGKVLSRAQELGYHVRTVILGTGITADGDIAAVRSLDLEITPVRHDNLDAITADLSRCAGVVSERYHGCLAALLMGVPTIGLATQISRKTEALFEGIDKSENVFTVDDPALLDALASLPEPIDGQTIEVLQSEASGAVDEILKAARHASPPILPLAPSLQAPPSSYECGFLNSPEQNTVRIAERSPRLLADPNFDLSLGTELSWYRTQIRHHKGVDYLATIDALLDQNQLVAKLPPNTRAIVCVPVAGIHESSTIYGTLSLYGRQGPETLQHVVLLPYVNYPNDAERDPELWKPIHETIHQVQLAEADFPHLQLGLTIEAFDYRLPQQHGGIIGYVARRMYDLAMMGIHRAIQTGNIAPDADILLIRNDADANGMSRRYLQRLLAEHHSNPDADIFQGAVRWGTDKYHDYPGYGVVMTLKESFRALAHRNKADYLTKPGTNGSNVAVRMATLAAVGGVGNGSYFGAGGDDVELGLRVLAARTHQQREVFRYVAGAEIDASGERTLATYLSGRAITHSWDNFNQGPAGYQPRISSSITDAIGPERLAPAEAVDRIEHNINELARSWFNDIRLLHSVLRLVIGSHDDKGRTAYELSESNGAPRVTFTQEGRQWIEQRLERRRNGTPEPYGHRVQRSLYADRSTSPRSSRLIPALQDERSR